MNSVRKALLVFMAIVITAGTLWFTNRSVTPKDATWEDVQNEAKQGGYQIINTEELWKRYSNNPDSLLLVDARQEWEYRTGHIKGALNFLMEPTWWSRWGMALNLTPCVYPLILITVSYFGGLMQAASKSYAGYFGTLFMGLTMGVVAAPCNGPFVLGLLTWAASLGSPWLGFIVFFTLSLGLGLPLFFWRYFQDRSTSFLVPVSG